MPRGLVATAMQMAASTFGKPGRSYTAKLQPDFRDDTVMISDAESEPPASTPRRSGQESLFASPLMEQAERASPLPLSPLSDSCGEHQWEEDFTLHFREYFPLLSQQEEALLRQPASEDTRPIEVPTWFVWRFLGSLAEQQAQDKLRRKLVNAMVRADLPMLACQKGIYLGVAILDECLMMQKPKLRPLLLASVALTIAEKFEGDKDFAQLKDLNDAMGDHASNEELVMAELEMLNAIDYNLHRSTAEHHRYWIVEFVNDRVDLGNEKGRILKASEYLCEMTLLCASAGRWAPSVQAACGCLAAFTILQRESLSDEIWKFLVTERRWQQLRLAIRELLSLLKEDDINKTVIYQKYATLDHSYISIKVHGMLDKRVNIQLHKQWTP
mmetsp:Transcript_6998/g.15892  ORF Transcript_6998/g.15892 Transcript_6998/m.15892 type:complete len:385 (-) Transcript_6998:55-1209(-)